MFGWRKSVFVDAVSPGPAAALGFRLPACLPAPASWPEIPDDFLEDSPGFRHFLGRNRQFLEGVVYWVTGKKETGCEPAQATPRPEGAQAGGGGGGGAECNGAEGRVGLLPLLFSRPGLQAPLGSSSLSLSLSTSVSLSISVSHPLPRPLRYPPPP